MLNTFSYKLNFSACMLTVQAQNTSSPHSKIGTAYTHSNVDTELPQAMLN